MRQSWGSTTVRSTGGSCIALDGSAEGTVDDRTLKTEVDDYQRCLDAVNNCPAAGGKITIQSEKDGEQVSLSFDGSNDEFHGTSPITGTRLVVEAQ